MDGQISQSDDIAERGLRYTRDQFEQLMEQTEDYVRSNPTRAIMYAALAGLVLDRLPVGRMLGGIARLTLVAAKPAILIYGATKLYQAAQQDQG